MKMYMRTWAGRPSPVGMLPDDASDNTIRETAAAALSAGAIPVEWTEIEVSSYIAPAIGGWTRDVTRKGRQVGACLYEKDPRNA